MGVLHDGVLHVRVGQLPCGGTYPLVLTVSNRFYVAHLA